MIIRRRPRASGYLSASLLALTLTLPVCTMLFSATEAQAETRYVKPSAEVVVRTGQGNNYKIVGMVKDGTSVQFIEEGDNYALIRLPNGKDGWMLKRFLSQEPPLIDVVTSLRAEQAELKQKEMGAAQKFEEISVELSRTKAEFAAIIGERDQVRNDLQTLRRDTADVVQIKDDLQETAKENELLMQKLETIEQENSSMKKDKVINWFLAGAGVLLVGVLVGRMPSPTRRRKPSLL